MYYDEHTIIYFEGAYVKAAEARGNLFDQSLHYGYAVFEGIRAYQTDGGVRIFKAREHFERLKFSSTSIGIPYPYDNDELIAISYEVLRRNNLTDAYVRPLVTCPPNMSLSKGKGAQIFIAAWAWPAFLGDKPLHVATSPFRRITPASFHVEAKVSGHYVNSIMATQDARDRGFDEALLLDIDGYVAEGPGANIFIEKDGTLYTPQTGSILPGITRATVLELCAELSIPVEEKRLRVEDVYAADSAFYCGTAAEVVGIGSLDRNALTKPWEETLGAVLQKAYKELVLEKHLQTAATLA